MQIQANILPLTLYFQLNFVDIECESTKRLNPYIKELLTIMSSVIEYKSPNFMNLVKSFIQ